MHRPASLAAPGTIRPVLRLALPVLAGQLLDMMMGFSDKWLTGHFLPGAKYLAAITLVAYVLGFLPSLFAAVSISTTAMVARFVGAGDILMARRAANQALVLGMMLAAAIMTIGLMLGPRFVAILGLRGEAAELTLEYLTIVLPVIPAMMIEQVGVAVLRGAGDTVTGLIAMIFQNAMNIAVALALVRGWGPVPALGWLGLAIGAATGYCSTALIIFLRLLIGRYGLRFEWRLMRPDFLLIRRLLRIGIPGGLDILSIAGCQFWFLSIVNRLGNDASAAHGVAITIESLSYMPGAAFQVAATTLVGQYLGAREERRAVQAVGTSSLVAFGLMSLIAAGFYFGSNWLALQFVGDKQPEVAASAAMLVRIVAFGQPPLAILMVINGALRGAGDTRWTLTTTCIGFLLVRIPLAYFLAWDQIDLPLPGFMWTVPGLSLGVRGAWYAMLADLIVRCLLVLYRFLTGAWKRIEV